MLQFSQNQNWTQSLEFFHAGDDPVSILMEFNSGHKELAQDDSEASLFSRGYDVDGLQVDSMTKSRGKLQELITIFDVIFSIFWKR